MSTFRRCDLSNDDDGAPGAPETRLRVLAGVNVTISDGSAFSRSRGLPAAAAKRDAANRFGMNIAGLVDAMSAHLDTDEGERFGVVDDAAAAKLHRRHRDRRVDRLRLEPVVAEAVVAEAELPQRVGSEGEDDAAAVEHQVVREPRRHLDDLELRPLQHARRQDALRLREPRRVAVAVV